MAFASTALLFEAVAVFDGRSASRPQAAWVLVHGNRIARVSPRPIEVGPEVRRIDGSGLTLMPGLIDAHAHVMFAGVSMQDALHGDEGYLHAVAAHTASVMLRSGFTSIRDVGGPCFGLKKAIDEGILEGPRIWPSGPMISQSGGHGDFRARNELPSLRGSVSYGERIGASVIADSAAEVRRGAREALALGASQIKLMAGGGVSSPFDPLDVTQFTEEELRAAVEAAENWGTYVTVHAYTPRAVRCAIDAGVRCIEHGHLLDDVTVRRMAAAGAWWCLQPFIDEGPSPFPEGSDKRRKQLEMFTGTDTAYHLAREHGLKVAWGGDILFSAAGVAAHTALLTRMQRWYEPSEILQMVTATNAELLALSGPRTPYTGELGLVSEGALADLLLVNGDPVSDLRLLEDPERNLLLIMKDGRIVKERPEVAPQKGQTRGMTSAATAKYSTRTGSPSRQ